MVLQQLGRSLGGGSQSQWRRERLTVKYKSINEMSILPQLPIPIVEDILADLTSSKNFSTLDLVSGLVLPVQHR